MKRAALLVLLCISPELCAQDSIPFDFRGAQYDGRLFRFEGPNAAQFIKPEADGLHWRFSGGNAPNRPVGIMWSFPVRGDFVATAHYEVLHAKTDDTRLGIELYLTLNSETRDAIAFSRRVQGPSFIYLHLTNNQDGKRGTKEHKAFVTTDRTAQGRMRLARKDGTLHVAVAEGDAEEFQELHRAEIGDVNIRMMRFAALPAGKESELDVRLVEFTLQGEGLPRTGFSDRKRWVLFLPFIALFVAFILFVVLRARRGRTTKKEFAGKRDKSQVR